MNCEWEVINPGVIGIKGTKVCIKRKECYDFIFRLGPYFVFNDSVFVGWPRGYSSLKAAKAVAESEAMELSEMGPLVLDVP